MSWRRGELWLDTDVLWFPERAGAPAVASLAPASVFAPAQAAGLVASRQRRAAWKRRRNARRATATAIALSPALMLALAALRSGGDPATSVAAEDPPSLLLPLGRAAVETGERP